MRISGNQEASREAPENRKREMTTVSEKIDSKLVKELREKSGAPMGDCLKALQETKAQMRERWALTSMPAAKLAC
jgi:translation elongation factor EF-Ts